MTHDHNKSMQHAYWIHSNNGFSSTDFAQLKRSAFSEKWNDEHSVQFGCTMVLNRSHSSNISHLLVLMTISLFSNSKHYSLQCACKGKMICTQVYVTLHICFTDDWSDLQCIYMGNSVKLGHKV